MAELCVDAYVDEELVLKLDALANHQDREYEDLVEEILEKGLDRREESLEVLPEKHFTYRER
ncbi:MAG: hypothetical protein ABEJ36_03230 [Candidatus Nanosalina sp.]